MIKEPKIKKVKGRGGAAFQFCLTYFEKGEQKQEWFDTEETAEEALKEL